MAEPLLPLTELTEAQRAQALERFTIIRPALEEGVSWARVARTTRYALKLAISHGMHDGQISASSCLPVG